jgi:hypothetical protein
MRASGTKPAPKRRVSAGRKAFDADMERRKAQRGWEVWRAECYSCSYCSALTTFERAEADMHSLSGHLVITRFRPEEREEV